MMYKAVICYIEMERKVIAKDFFDIKGDDQLPQMQFSPQPRSGYL